MKKITELTVALDDLRFKSFDSISKPIAKTHYTALSYFLEGKLVESYKEMSRILRHYMEIQEPLPVPCRNLYRNLVLNDSLAQHITFDDKQSLN